MPTDPTQPGAGSCESREKSRVEVERVLRRHGATRFAYARDCTSGRITVSFVVPDSTPMASHEVAVQLPIDVRRVYDRLFGQPSSWVQHERPLLAEELAQGLGGGSNGGVGGQGSGVGERQLRTGEIGGGYDSRKLEHAEQVAWRHLVRWLDSVLAAVAAGFQTNSEAFFAHTVVAFDDGRRGRLVDYLESEQSHLAPGIRALLAAPNDEIAA